MPHVLVVDDDDRIRDLVSRYLNEHGFFSVTAASADEAEDVLKVGLFDALVVDVMMPGRNGREFTKDLRKTNDVPVLLLTALGEAEDRISGLESGADDYLPKPFDPRELLLRLQAIMRRRPRAEMPQGPVTFGPWTFDPLQNEVIDGDTVVKLTDVEATLLKALTSRMDDIISRSELARICGMDAGERTVDVQVARLRRKIEKDSKMPRFLQTVRGKGYILRSGQ